MPFVEADVETVWVERSADGINFGWAVSGVADLDGDGVDDVLASDPFVVGNDGSVVVMSGKDGSTLHTFTGTPGGLLGYSVADAGDVDGDGVNDIVAGALAAETVTVWSGADGGVVLTLAGPTPGESFGSAVAGPGDIDGDGLADVLVGAETAFRTGEDSGAASLWSADGSLLLEVSGAEAGDRMGGGAGAIGDVDGDEIPDLVLGARDAGPGDGGQVIVLSGADGGGVHELQSADAVDLGIYFVAGVGDLDADGVPDVYGGDFSSDGGRGRGTVWSGRTGEVVLSVTGATASSGIGPGRGAGDVNGDGFSDLVLGSWTSSEGAPQAGRIDVVSGADAAILHTVTSTRDGENFGFDAVGIGDADGDGSIDIVVSAATDNRVYVIGWPVADDEAAGDPVDTTGDDRAGCGCATPTTHGSFVVTVGALLAGLRRRRSAVEQSRHPRAR